MQLVNIQSAIAICIFYKKNVPNLDHLWILIKNLDSFLWLILFKVHNEKFYL